MVAAGIVAEPCRPNGHCPPAARRRIRFHAVANPEVIAATFLLPSTSAQPLVVELPHHALRLVVVNNGSVGLLDDSWDAAGVYVLLGHGSRADEYNAYVGKA